MIRLKGLWKGRKGKTIEARLAGDKYIAERMSPSDSTFSLRKVKGAG